MVKMENTKNLFDVFVEKIVVHNKLISADKLTLAKAYLTKHPQMSLLQVLLKSGLVNQKLSNLIDKKYIEYATKHDYAPQSTSAEVSPPDDSPVENLEEFSSMEDSASGNEDAKANIGSESLQASHQEQPGASGNARSLKNEMGLDDPIRKLSAKQTLEQYLTYAKLSGASDLHLSANSPPMMRKNKQLIPMDSEVLSAEDTERLIFQVLKEEQKQVLIDHQMLEICLMESNIRYKCCFIKQRAGYDGSFRIIGDSIPRFDDLGLPDELRRLTDYREGLVLVTGPSGSGKSTTMAAFVDLINRKRKEHIITLEEPVEHVFNPDLSHISQREVGLHTDNYSNALRAALREDPDVIVVGELRDLETTSLAITAAETGHLVFGTMHTASATQSIIRLLDFFPQDQRDQIRSMISESLRGIICQRLVPTKDRKGLVLALEVMFNNMTIAKVIREDRIHQLPNMIQMNKEHGMRTLNDSLMELFQKELIFGEDAYFASENKDRFKRWAPKLAVKKPAENVYGED